MPRPASSIPSRVPEPYNWRDGDIAFLKGVEDFDMVEYEALIKTKYLHPGATGHPVIILERSKDSKYFLVTTISAYRSGRENDYLPPWEQEHHSWKCPGAFRAFSESARPDNKRKYLYLEGNASLPKPKTSWVYTRTIFVVPSSVLWYFDKAPEPLRMTRESLKDLLGHMKENWGFADRWNNPKVCLSKRLLESRAPKLTSASAAKPITMLKDTKSEASKKVDPCLNRPSTTSNGAADSKPCAPKPLWSTIAKAAPPASTTSLRSVSLRDTHTRVFPIEKKSGRCRFRKIYDCYLRNMRDSEDVRKDTYGSIMADNGNGTLDDNEPTDGEVSPPVHERR
ncbi:hypothetical protein GGS26DRAFT_594313 [Hypomontagnella submonticulosa]|nr:hypothetical protein GGS26DRAFT_594313 [Hypomontagnella submonticulosa]